MLLALLLTVSANSFASSIDVDRLADAIKRAENSHRHPYGILKAYCKAGDKNGRCRKGCIQTINKRLEEYRTKIAREILLDNFIVFLSKSYAPVGSKNDPTNLNKNWIKNVKYFYERA